MFESLIGTIAIVALIVVVARQHSRLGLLEREIGALRSFVLTNPPAAGAAAAGEPVARETAPDVAAVAADIDVEKAASETPETAVAAALPDAAEAGPWSVDTKPVMTDPTEPAKPLAAPKRPDIETALGTRWAVWVGGLALALGGLFLIRYSIEAGIFGPGVRLTMAALLGLVLVGGGEFIRRTGFKVPVEGAAGAYVPGILTAAGAFTLFGAVYAAHGIYGFIGPTLGFALMGIIGVGTIAAALVHGQALAGIGLLGSMITPVLVSSQSPNAWALFGYLAIVLVANTVIARMRDWKFLAAAGFVGAGLWCLLYLSDASAVDLTVVMFTNAVTLGALAFVWLGRRTDGAAAPETVDWPSIAPAFFVALAATMLIDPDFQIVGGAVYGGVLIVAMLVVALYRPRGLPLLHAAGIATVVVHAQAALAGSFVLEFSGGELAVEGFPLSTSATALRPVGVALALAFLVAGYWQARQTIAVAPGRAAAWAGWGTLVPLAVACLALDRLRQSRSRSSLRRRRARSRGGLHRRRRGDRA